jgi:hypothetical protein
MTRLKDPFTNHPFFTLTWAVFLLLFLRFVSQPVRDFALVCWFYGRDGYFKDGIRVIAGGHGRGPTRFTNGELVPAMLDTASDILTFVITAVGLTLLLVAILMLCERIRKRASNNGPLS